MAIPELNRPPRAQGLILVYGEGKLETRETPATQRARAGPASPSLGPETRLCRLPGCELPAGTPRQASGGLPSQRCVPTPWDRPPERAPTPAPGPPLRRAWIQLHTLAHEETGPCDGCRDRTACWPRLFHRKPLATGKDARLSRQGT